MKYFSMQIEFEVPERWDNKILKSMIDDCLKYEFSGDNVNFTSKIEPSDKVRFQRAQDWAKLREGK